MTSSTFIYRASLIAVVALAAACVDSAPSTAPSTFDETEDPLALTFDALSAQSDSSGDRARSEGFASAALPRLDDDRMALRRARHGERAA